MKRVSNSLTAPIMKILFWLLILAGATIVFFRLISRLPNEIPTSANSDKTSTPTSLLTSDNSILFDEDFEDGKAQQIWNIVGDWKIISDETGNKVYNIVSPKGNDYPSIDFGAETWDNYLIEYRFRFIGRGNNWATISFRRDQTRTAQYIISFQPNNTTLYYTDLKGDWFGIVNHSYSLKEDTWYWIKVEANNENIDLYINNQPIINTNDMLYKSGSAELSVGPDTHTQFDDIQVRTLKK